MNTELISWVKKQPMHSITDAKTIAAITLSNDTSLFDRIKPELQYMGLYPEVLSSVDEDEQNLETGLDTRLKKLADKLYESQKLLKSTGNKKYEPIISHMKMLINSTYGLFNEK